MVAAAVSISSRLRAPPSTSRAHTSIAVKAGQVAVEHDHVVVVDERARQAGLAVERDIDRHPRVTQPGRDRLGQLLIVFDHKHAHRCSFAETVAAARFQHGFSESVRARSETFPKPPVT